MPPKGWIVSDAQSYCTKIADGTHDSPKQSAIGNLLVTSKNIIDGELDLSKSYFISEEDYSKINRRSKVDKNDVLLSMIGTVGQACVVEQEPNFAIKNVGLLKNDDPIKAKWLYFYLSSPKAQQLIKERLKGTTQQYLSLGEIRKLPVFYPESHDVMKRVVYFLDSLRKKIIINNSVSRTLEQMAQALFKSWFVDFEPVKAKVAVMEAGGSQEDATLAAMTAISGKNADALVAFEREHPEQYAELKATAELFPSAMQESELGEFPAGWILGPLSDIAIFANEKVDISSLTSETYISTENMLENRAGISTASSLPSVNSVPGFRSGHVLISNIRPYFKKIWLARFKGGRSADVLAFEARDSVTVEYIYNLLYQDSFFDFMMLTSKGVKMPRGDKTAIMGWQCVCPDKKVSYAFSKAVGEYYSFIEINNTQNKTLTQLRDTLLPKLLSGEIILPEAEQAVSEVENV
ncbi:hypothetical protein H000_05289 [Escherichia coli UMEA 3899-1]|nr:hypothetical protein H000_05289 [Escherichia coli UMEA 3899-1]CAD5548922.1 type I restriction modification DNA specificity domain-containing protein [Escherichia coli]CAD5554628.1 type I restriction modification DNA specificity domain-containing protein [Escherichia coli]STI92182.1 type I restriction modification DNA specificity domain-containing protein [Escherichia coli]STJ76654.1 type I restriction modification DNA specificity domain-containing protein [Escherichia coli]